MDPIKTLAGAIMRAVANSGVITESRIPGAVEIMRAELKAFIADSGYAAERDLVLSGALDASRVVTASIVAGCIAKIGRLPA